jgi:gliding motility-associated-like protein
VFVKNVCGSASDDIIIENGICDIFFPSAFTPNNDGKNDVFKILGRANFSYYRLSMYNNWGQKIFETNDPSIGWDGKLHGRSQNTGGYVWYCNFKRQNASENRSMKGTVLLIR